MTTKKTRPLKSNKEMDKRFVKLQKDFCKVLDVFVWRSEEFTEDKAVSCIMLSAFLLDIYAENILDKKDMQYVKEKIMLKLLSDQDILTSDLVNTKEKVLH